jgi:hypothetical protein
MIRSLQFAFVLMIVGAMTQVASAQESKAAQATRQKLKQKISVDFKDVATSLVFNEIKGEMEKGTVNFRIDNKSGVSNNSKLTYKAKDKAVEEILNELSDKYEFGWVVISNASNNKVDGWVEIRKSSKGKERGHEAGKEPKGSSSAPMELPRREVAFESSRLRWIETVAITSTRASFSP